MAYPGVASKYTLPVPPPAWMTPTNSVGGNYTAAVNQQAGDYDMIMRNYQDLLGLAKSSASQNPLSFSAVAPTTVPYMPAPAYQRTDAFNKVAGDLSTMTQTGGYSDEDINNLRARGVSPIRAVYAAARQNLERQKALQGGYSPNYGALQSKMAREQAGILSEKLTDVNAGIADRVASGKQFALSQSAPLLARENEATNAVGAANAAGVNATNLRNAEEASRVGQFNTSMEAEIAKLNASIAGQNQNMMMAPIQGMASLYGTTPALTNTFGNQVLAAGNQNIAANQAVNQLGAQRTSAGLGLINALPPISYGTDPYRNIRRG